MSEELPPTEPLWPVAAESPAVAVRNVAERNVAEPAAMTPPTGVGAWLRRHGVAFAITAGVLAAVLISGATAFAVGMVTSGSGQSAASAPLEANKAAGGALGHGAARSTNATKGRITAMSGSNWTVATLKGGDVQVTVDASTRFGTRAKPATAGDFTVGETIVVVGARSGDGITATRIGVAGHGGGAGSNPTSTPAPSSSGA